MAVPTDHSSDKELSTVPIADKIALTLAEACALSSLRMYQFREAINRGDLPFIQNGARGRYVIRRESLEKFLREQERKS